MGVKTVGMQAWRALERKVGAVLMAAVLVVAFLPSCAGVAQASGLRCASTASGECGSCTWELDASGVLTISAGADGSTLGNYILESKVPWYDYRTSITQVVFADAVTCASYFRYYFAGCTNLVSIEGLSLVDTSAVTDMYCLFQGCSSLETLDLSGFDTAKVTNMGCLFQNCSSLASLDLSGFDVGTVTSTESMFEGCSALTALDLSNFSTTCLVNAGSMFSGCTSLATLDISALDTTSVAEGSMDYIFKGCTALRTVKVGEYLEFVGANSHLPLPVSASYGTGWWVNSAGTVYTDVAEIPSDVATTYTAAFNTSSTTSAKKAQTLKVTAKKKTVKASKLKKKALAFKLITVKGAKGKVTYAKVAKGSSKKLSVNKKTGKITVKKGTKKGTYKLKVKVTAAATAKYKKATKTVTVTVKVKK